MDNNVKDSRAERFKNVDILRFIFAVIIVYFHLVRNDIFNNVSELCTNFTCPSTVDNCYVLGIFMIMAGFFLFKEFNEKPERSWTDFALNKISRLWPVLAFSVLAALILHIFYATQFSFGSEVFSLLFLKCTGVTLDYTGINWFISPYFWVMLFYFYVLKHFKFDKANFIIALVIYFSTVASVNYFHGRFDRETFALFFSGGMLYCLAGIGLGYFIGLFYEKVKNCSEIFKTAAQKFIKFVIVSVIELCSFSFIIYHFFFKPLNNDNKIIYMIILSVLFFCFLIKQGLLSKIFNNNISEFLGKYSYSIYVMQQVAFDIMGITLWKHTDFLANYPVISIALSLLIAILTGIFTYHLVEVLGGKFLRAVFKNIKEKI